ncbi:GTP 3',8-cyclase MoaA [Nevskia soli]|uniref:GTP 3',8-cyclase MoaA n=1 Tax=Nevskia soli TaxID=418856 RepID=UPI0004A7847A|nr:GTP 3',8-cyclase MoaA [Nevskia soli]
MIDPFGRKISYVRVSVTDRCDLRCVYCMSENMVFKPKPELLSFDELERLCTTFVKLGIRKIRLTGGEPLVRHGIMGLIDRLGGLVKSGQLDELTLTTNGTQLVRHAEALAKAGIRRINVSIDTLDTQRFAAVTRGGKLDRVLAGIEAAKAAGIHVKVNTVALRGVNEDEIGDLVAWCGSQGHDLALIETMPLGEIADDRADQYVSLATIRRSLERRFALRDIDYRTGGPARYAEVIGTGTRLGFITPMSHNFCEACNRVRVTCTGTMYMCLGQEDAVDLRAPLRASEGDDLLESAILKGIARKPKGHEFVIERYAPAAVRRHMSVTGG